MNSVERVMSAIRQMPPDRVPLDLWARPEVWKALASHFNVRSSNEVRRCLGADIVLVSVEFEDRQFALTASARVPGESTIGGRLAIDHGDGTYTDQWGVRYGLDEARSVERIVQAPFPEASFPEEYRWPSLNDVESVESLRARIASLHDEGFCVFVCILNPFKQAWQLRGFDEFLMDLYVNRDSAAELLCRLGDYAVEMARRSVQAGADVILLVGDVAMQDRMLFSADVFGSVVAPVFKRIIGATAGAAQVPYGFHSDGDIMEILPHLIEAGFTIVNPIQPESMDPVEVKRRYGHAITLYGTVSVQTLLPRGTEREVRETIRRMIDLCGRDGGLILSTTNDAMSDIPLANLLAFYDEARNYSAGGHTRNGGER